MSKTKIKKDSSVKPIKRDGLENVLSKKGSIRSKTGTNIYTATDLLRVTTLRELYNSGGIASKIITRVADDITRKGFTITENTDSDVIKKFDSLEATKAFNTAIRWARLYGGGLIVMQINDGQKPRMPLNERNIKKFEKLRVFEAGSSQNVTILEKYTDSRKSNYGDPKLYHVNTGTDNGLTVHESRCIRLDGRVVDTQTKQKLNGWSGSELQPVYESLLSMLSQLMSGEQVLDELVIGVLKIENLDAMCVDSEGEALLQKRIELVDTSKSNETSLVIDLNEDYQRHTVNLSGMSNLQQNAMTLVAGASDIPATFLYGSSPDGQNATGASDEAQYYGKIDAERLYFYKPALLRLLRLLSTNENIDVEFPILKTDNFYDTARGFNHITKGLADLVKEGIISQEEAKGFLTDSKAIERIKMIS